MDNLFNPIEFSVDWGFIFGFISVISLTIAGLRKFFIDSKLDINVYGLKIESILSKPNEFANEVKIIMHGEDIEQLNKIIFYIKNTGRKSISSKSFYQFPKIYLSGFANIINLNISTSNKYTSCITRKIDHSQLEFEIDNFEYKDYIKIEILFETILDDYLPIFEVHLKESKENKITLSDKDMDNYYTVKKDWDAVILYIPMFSLLISLLLTYLFVRYGLNIDVSDTHEFSLAWKILFYLPAAVIVVYFYIKNYKSVYERHFGQNNIDLWYNKSPIQSEFNQ